MHHQDSNPSSASTAVMAVDSLSRLAQHRHCITAVTSLEPLGTTHLTASQPAQTIGSSIPNDIAEVMGGDKQG